MDFMMKVNNIRPGFKQTIQSKKQTGLLEKFHEKAQNSADMTDTIVVPRTIFKGYLGIMAGTTLITAGNIIKNNKISKVLSIGGLITSLYGTYAFVRPFIIKDTPGVERNRKREK